MQHKTNREANRAMVRTTADAPHVVRAQSKYTCYCQVAKLNLLCLRRPIDFCNCLRYIHFSVGVCVGGSDIVENNTVWHSAAVQQRSHFPNPAGVFHQEKERQRKEGKNHWALFREPSGCSDPTGLKRRQRGALSPSDK